MSNQYKTSLKELNDMSSHPFFKLAHRLIADYCLRASIDPETINLKLHEIEGTEHHEITFTDQGMIDFVLADNLSLQGYYETLHKKTTMVFGKQTEELDVENGVVITDQNRGHVIAAKLEGACYAAIFDRLTKDLGFTVGTVNKEGREVSLIGLIPVPMILTCRFNTQLLTLSTRTIGNTPFGF